jgi:hypothetical protein
MRERLPAGVHCVGMIKNKEKTPSKMPWRPLLCHFKISVAEFRALRSVPHWTVALAGEAAAGIGIVLQTE